ncbi:amidohydrolase family protein, partial [Porticoccaceae bacterium]|nr:amidohydrolase family protein [Porticoccaceae bacterium]
MGCSDYFIEKAFLADGWHNNVGLSVDDRGYISQVRKNAQPSKQDELLGWVMPGLVNCHSHAFQRAMAGYTEYRVSDTDTFWSWRETMYRHANSINPEQLLDISAYLYMELI